MEDNIYENRDVPLINIYISKAMTQKILFLGCEKYYLKFISLPFLLALIMIGPGLNFPIALILIINYAILVIFGKFLAKKNPYWVEIAIRHLGYKNFYLSHGKYSLRNEKPWYRGTKGERTYLNVDRNN